VEEPHLIWRLHSMAEWEGGLMMGHRACTARWMLGSLLCPIMMCVFR
jgi:hypothetical protein